MGERYVCAVAGMPEIAKPPLPRVRVELSGELARSLQYLDEISGLSYEELDELRDVMRDGIERSCEQGATASATPSPPPAAPPRTSDTP